MNDVDNVIVALKYKGGLLAQVDCSRIAEYGYDQRVEVSEHARLVRKWVSRKTRINAD